MSMTTTAKASVPVNGLDLEALREVVREIERDPRNGMVGFNVRSAWRGQTRSRSTVESYSIGGRGCDATSRSTWTSRTSSWARTPPPIRRRC